MCVYQTCIRDVYQMCDTHMYGTVYEYDMGSLQLVGSSKLKVSFAEYHLFFRALLQKRPIILRSLLIVATPYVHKYDMYSTFRSCTDPGA